MKIPFIEYFTMFLPFYLSHNIYKDIDECLPNLCQNGATCRDQISSFSCICPPGFTGALCQSGIK